MNFVQFDAETRDGNSKTDDEQLSSTGGFLLPRSLSTNSLIFQGGDVTQEDEVRADAPFIAAHGYAHP